MTVVAQRQQIIISRLEQVHVDLTDLRANLAQLPAAADAAVREATVSAQNAYISAQESAGAADAAKAAVIESQKTRKALVEYVVVGTCALLLALGVSVVFSVATFLQARAAQRAISDVSRVLIT